MLSIQKTRAINHMKRFQFFMLSISPILHMYRFISIITWGELALVLCAVIAIMKDPKEIKVTRKVWHAIMILMYFAIVSLIATLILSSGSLEFIKEYLAFLVYYVIALIMLLSTDVSSFLKIYEKVALVVALFVITQFLAYIFWGKHISGLIPNMTTYFGNSTNYYIARQSARFAAFFTEPAMCARYLSIPLLTTALRVSEKGKSLNLSMIIYTGAILFTMSGNGLVALSIVYAISLYRLMAKKNFKSFIKVLGLAGLMIVSIVILNNVPMFNNLFSRVAEISGDSSMKSGYIRIVRGFVAYLNLPFLAKIFGVGFGNYSHVIDKYLYSVLTAETDLIISWINGVQIYFIYGGIIGVLLFATFLFKGVKTRSKNQNKVLLLFLAYLFMAGMFNEPLWVLFIMLILTRNSSFSKRKGELNIDFSNYTNA